MKIITKNANGDAKTYDVYRVAGNRAEYISGDHSDLKKDKCIVSSNSGGVTKTSLGNRKSSINFVKTNEVDTRLTEKELTDAKIEILTSFPAGMSDDQVSNLIANAREFFTQSPDVLLQIVRKGMIS